MTDLYFGALLVICAIAMASASAGLKFEGEKLPFAEYRPWDLSTNGSVELYFQTHRENAMVLYQDDGDGRDWIDVYLVDGRARMRLTLGLCHAESKILNGSFADSQWHYLKVQRNFTTTTFSIDGAESELIECEITDESPVKPKPSKTSLFLGGIPIIGNSLGRWSNPGIFTEISRYLFSGCIARVQYSDGKTRLRTAKFRNSSGTTPDCEGACADQCKNGGKCIDLLVRVECDCRGTGYVGEYCHLEYEEILASNSTSLANITVGMVAAHVRGLAPSLQPLSLIATMLALTCGIVLNTDFFQALLDIYGA